MFDEATSALDNLTQAIVTESITRVGHHPRGHRAPFDHGHRRRSHRRGQERTDRPVRRISSVAGRTRSISGAGPPAIDLNQRRRARSGCRRLAQRKPQELQALAAEVLVLPRIARAAKLHVPPLGHRRAVGPLPPLVALTMSRLGGMVQILGFSGNSTDRPRASTVEVLSVAGPRAGSETLEAVQAQHV